MYVYYDILDNCYIIISVYVYCDILDHYYNIFLSYISCIYSNFQTAHSRANTGVV